MRIAISRSEPRLNPMVAQELERRSYQSIDILS